MVTQKNEGMADLLDAGADLIEKHGHTKGQPGNRTSGYCIVGALDAVVGERWGEYSYYYDTAGALSKHLGFGERLDVIGWNDAEERTPEEVITAMRDCAYHLRHKS